MDVYLDSMLAAKHFLYRSRRHAGRSGKLHTKDCFLNGGGFLSRENRERVGYTEQKKGRESAKSEQKSESE